MSQFPLFALFILGLASSPNNWLVDGIWHFGWWIGSGGRIVVYSISEALDRFNLESVAVIFRETSP
jgi:hypothetical protein